MAQLRQDELSGVREQFFEGELPHRSNAVVAYNPNKYQPKGPLTPAHMMNRIDARLRRVVVKACENSFPASKVVHTLEAFLVRAYAGKSDTTPRDTWKELLLEPPTVTHRKRDDTYITRFLFDADSSTGGFHRLLLHGLCQFHGLGATSSSMEVVVEGGKGKSSARLLTASGTLSGAEVKLVDLIMQRKQQSEDASLMSQVDVQTTNLDALKV